MVIEFRDAGEGIPASHLSKLFDPVFHDARGPAGAGAGPGAGHHFGARRDDRGGVEPSGGAAFRVILPAAPPARHRSFDPAGGTGLRATGRVQSRADARHG